MKSQHIAVVGASAAGVTVVDTLRAEGYKGRITLIGDELDLPYDRPPLSKQLLAPTADWAATRLRHPDHFEASGVEVVLGRRAVSVDARGNMLHLSDGSSIPYSSLAITTGARARELPLAEGLTGVRTLRTLQDARSLSTALAEIQNLVVIGAGFLGMEVAAAARLGGKEVTVVDTEPLPLMRPFGPAVGIGFLKLHESHGVTFRLGTAVDGLESEDGRVTAVRLADGSICRADLVVVAVGAQPNSDWLDSNDFDLTNGIVCDPFCRAATSVYAAGDVATWHNRRFMTHMRLENRLNATEQAMAAARNMLGAQSPYAPVPYYWTQQFGINLQAHGIFPRNSDFVMVAGQAEDLRFAAYYVVEGTVVGTVGARMAGQIRAGRAAILQRMSISEALVSA